MIWDWVTKTLVVLVVLFALVSVYAVYKLNQRTTQCNQLGGVLVKTAEGYICTKLEKIV